MGRLLFSWLVLIFCAFSNGELFTALSDIEPLLTTQQRVMEDLEDYIHKEEVRLGILKRYLKVYKREHVAAMADIPDYLGNPINAFTLIKRLTKDLEFVKLNIDLAKEHASDTSVTRYEGATYPGAEDLTGAAVALTRLQDTYLLRVPDLAEGILSGGVHSSKMSASDCYEFGRVMFDEKDFRNTVDWMTTALHKMKQENCLQAFREIDIFEYLSLSHYFLGNIRDALIWTNKILEVVPNHSDALKKKIEFEKFIKTQKDLKECDEVEEESKDTIDNDVDEEADYDEELYKALCRGEVELSPAISKQLKCRYYNENPFLKLAPLKMEYKHLEPDIVLFYEVLSDEEIETMKRMAQPGFMRASVHDGVTGALTPVDYRISKSAWLPDDASPVVARVNRRVEDMTGLNMDTAEFLQVVNYGIGGHYLPHFDHATMSDVAQGGATVFTELGLSLFPVRGAAAVWLNLHASGEGDLATRHAACPVLRGSKWVCNKWIHLVGQEFIKPCGLEYLPGRRLSKVTK